MADEDKTREQLAAELLEMRRRIARLEESERLVEERTAELERAGALVQEETKKREQSEVWFRRLLEAAPDAMLVTDQQGEIVLANEAATRLFGYSREELVGQGIEMLCPAGVREKHRQQRLEFVTDPHVRPMGSGLELSAVRKGGAVFPVDISLGPMKTAEGMFVFVAVRDITHLKLADQALRDSEERFDLAMRGSDAGVWDWDLRTNTMYFSPRWKSMLGYGESEISHSFEEWESRLHPDDRQRASAAIAEYLKGRSPSYELEHRLRHKDGSYRWILSRGAAVRNAQGKPYRVVGSHFDITNRKAMEERLRQREADLLAAREIQRHLLPHAPPVLEGFDIAGDAFPAEFAAGDYFDYLALPDGRLGVVVGDVSGHGIGPALVMASTRERVRSLSETSSDISSIVRRTNSVLFKETSDDRFVTLILVCLDPQSMTLEYVNAGHPTGYVLNSSGGIKAALRSIAFPLGVMAEIDCSTGAPVTLEAGDIVLLVTDGILETQSADGHFFGTDRALAVVRKNREKPAHAIVEAVHDAIHEFSGHMDHCDDVTAVVVKVGPPSLL